MKILDAERFEDFVSCKISEVVEYDDHGDPNVATIQGAWISALEWVEQLIEDEATEETRKTTVFGVETDAIGFEERYCKNCDRYIECEVDGWICEKMQELQEGYEV